MENIKILVVDDHPMMREALIAALEGEPGMQVIGEAADGLEAIHMAEDCCPDLILMDLLMPGMGGIEATTRLVAAHPNIRIMTFTSLEEEDKILAAVQAGALGYFPKTAPRAYLLEAIRKVADGIPYLPAGIAQKLFKSIREMKDAPPTQNSARPALTARQEEILALLGEGKADKEIGARLHLGEATVRSHIHHILQRLDLETRSQAVAYANRARKPV
jgi:DNA-binding NarL/FixJ family response regulator